MDSFKLSDGRDNRTINRDIIKYIAIMCMLINHIAYAFLSDSGYLFQICDGIGKFTAITMIYFLVDGYFYTKSLKKYFIRLLIFALISQPFFYIVFCKGKDYFYLNFLFTLILCLLSVRIYYSKSNISIKYLIFIVIIVLSGLCDWNFLAIIMTLLFLLVRDKRITLFTAYISSAICTSLMTFLPTLKGGKNSLLEIIIGFIFMLFSYVLIRYFYNGKKALKYVKFNKYFFYIFYPLHLIIISLFMVF
ncbi:MAG: conjugal transfer protein TraX [Lachnospiraceae bacterium]|nr:conjugal transfer protein TraX [Lachnospiraceae bacterium]